MKYFSAPRRMLENALRQAGAFVFFILLSVTLSACASRPGPETLDVASTTVPSAKIITIYLATSRERTGDNRYGDVPAETMSFAEYRISIPPSHTPGQIEYPSGKQNPQTHFAVVSEAELDRATFLQRVGAGKKGKSGGIGIFVHGFNTSLPEALFRRAQLAVDSNEAEDNDVSVLFAWPSMGTVSGYLADKAAATASRDQLTDLLSSIARARPSSEITLIAHSMGGWLTTEALRQLKLIGQQSVLDRLKVVLAAPDIDGFVFLAQMQKIGRMRKPMTVLVSKDDLALAVSSVISMDQMRIGQIDIHDPRVMEGAAAVNIQFVDISAVETDDAFRHNGFAALAAIYPEMKKQNAKADPLKISSAGVFVFNAVTRTLTAPIALGRHLAGSQ